MIRQGCVRRTGGQALVEFALVFPIFLALLFALIVFGLYVFYQQQLANAARDAARYAATHSSTAQCPTVSTLDPVSANRAESYYRCDPPELGWPRMTQAARSAIWGMSPAAVNLTACWSGFQDSSGNHDALPSSPNTFAQCTIGGLDPTEASSSMACPAGAPSDTASALAAVGNQNFPTRVSVYACFNWTPPMAGFVLMPSSFTLRAVVTEVLHRQQ